MAEKKQIVFAASVVLIGIAGIYSFTSDLVRSFKNNKPSIIDKSEIEEQKEMFGMAKEEIRAFPLPCHSFTPPLNSSQVLSLGRAK